MATDSADEQRELLCSFWISYAGAKIPTGIEKKITEDCFREQDNFLDLLIDSVREYAPEIDDVCAGILQVYDGELGKASFEAAVDLLRENGYAVVTVSPAKLGNVPTDRFEENLKRLSDELLLSMSAEVPEEGQ